MRASVCASVSIYIYIYISLSLSLFSGELFVVCVCVWLLVVLDVAGLMSTCFSSREG